MFRTTRIRTKLAFALAIPLAALVVVAGLEVRAARDDVTTARSQADLATASVGPGSLVVQLQNERNRASIDLIGMGENVELPVADDEEARAITDSAVAAFRDEIAGRGPKVEATFAPAWEALEQLDELRADIDGFQGPRNLANEQFAGAVFERYTTVIGALLDGTSGVALAVDDAVLRNGIEILDAATRQSEIRAQLVKTVLLATITGTADDAAVGQLVAGLHDRGGSLDDVIRVGSTGIYTGVGDATFTEQSVQSFTRQIEAFMAGEPIDIPTILSAAANDPEAGYTGLRTRAAELLVAEAQRIQDDAVARERLFGGIALAGLVVALLTTWLASRSITRPLRSLRKQADQMATSGLPAAVRQILDTPAGEDVVIPEVPPITVKTRDEVSEVAASLSAVQASALDLAVEQAVLRRNISDSYVNLGRRNQNLLTRQLDFITDLERNESDPDTLEGLFRLDHLATRMRRNAESLLVLAGVEPPRQWSAPVKLSDVVRAALGEVEDYQRVVVRNLEPAELTGAIAADVAHVLAELIENGLAFSPPDQSVEVKGRLTTSGYTIAITDNGLGMNAADLDRANQRLAAKESFTVAPSRYLGHYVAGHLATRLGVAVELQDSPAGGVTARVDIAMSLLSDEELATPAARQLPPPPAPAVAAPVADSEPAPAPADSEPAPVAPAQIGPAHVPEAPAPATSLTTVSGLPKRGERPLVAPAADPDTVPSAVPAVEPASLEPVASLPPPPLDDLGPDVVPTAAPAAAAAEPPAPATPAFEVPASEAPQPPVPAASHGFGGLMVTPTGPSLHTLAARAGRAGHAEPVTTGGLARRVPGAQRPDGGLASRSTTAEDASATTEPARTSPEDVYSFLSSFQSGVARGRAESTDEIEEGR